MQRSAPQLILFVPFGVCTTVYRSDADPPPSSNSVMEEQTTTAGPAPRHAFQPWLPGRKHNLLASKEETANRLYNLWTQRHDDPEKKMIEDLVYEDIEGDDDLMDLLCDYAIALVAHPVYEGWHKPIKEGDQCCIKRVNVDYVMSLYTAIFQQLRERFPQHPLLQGDEKKISWWRNQHKELRKNLERESKNSKSCC